MKSIIICYQLQKANCFSFCIKNFNSLYVLKVILIHFVYKIRCNVSALGYSQIRQQCQSFTQGLENVLKLDWLRMFNHHELHILISGATSPIDVSDLKAHTLYSGKLVYSVCQRARAY